MNVINSVWLIIWEIFPISAYHSNQLINCLNADKYMLQNKLLNFYHSKWLKRQLKLGISKLVNTEKSVTYSEGHICHSSIVFSITLNVWLIFFHQKLNWKYQSCIQCNWKYNLTVTNMSFLICYLFFTIHKLQYT